MKWHMAIQKKQLDVGSQTRIERKSASDLQEDGGISSPIRCSRIDGQAEIKGIEMGSHQIKRLGQRYAGVMGDETGEA